MSFLGAFVLEGVARVLHHVHANYIIIKQVCYTVHIAATQNHIFTFSRSRFIIRNDDIGRTD